MADVKRYDVIVVGGGNAALCAALSAHESGAKTVVLEAAPKELRGGNSRFASACFRVVHNGMQDIEPLIHPDNKYLVKRARLAPFTKDRYRKEFQETSKGHHDKAIMGTLIDNSLDTVYWMRDKGVRWTIALSKFFTEEQITRDVVDINPGLCLMAQDEGIGLTDNLWAAVEKTSIDVYYGSPACDLIAKGDTIQGVRVRGSSQFIDFYGNVILGCGGFEASPRLRRQYLGEGWDLVCVRGTRYNTGTMLEKAIAAGAGAAGHWGGCHAVPMDINSPAVGDLRLTDKMSRYSYPFAIMVNKEGKRFMDEGRDTFELTYAATGDLIGKQTDSTAFQIFDQKSLITLEPRYSTGKPVEAETLAELGTKLGLNVREFLKTVEEFNAAVPDSPAWDPFHKDGRSTGDKLAIPKTNWAQTVDQGPFVAYVVTCGITFTYGGLKTDARAHVLNHEGNRMPGLWAVGEISGGLFAYNYPGASGLVKGSVFGKIAGAAAAEQALQSPVQTRL
ncbi:precorrin 3B synthase CobZ [Exophiala mesophila]|uniref:Precorrin 3B synthase CobZ n=1 Tax=Exophiala mesophila TaxID=212818 RepID=A0A0D1ZPI9_EXOME|nr:precorrin 3B synthase CobZ [Exophiala mesophila]KIV96492.1 precorrin 3B synthase CobZ [Exophiala mesophila]